MRENADQKTAHLETFHAVSERAGSNKNTCVLVWQLDGENVRILEPVKHLTKNIQYGYNWTILANTSKHARTIENLKAIYIALLKLSLNDQLKSRNCSFLEMG